MLLCFFILFLFIFRTFFIIPLINENARVKLTLAIPAGAPITLIKKIIEFLHLLHMKQLNSCLYD